MKLQRKLRYLGVVIGAVVLAATGTVVASATSTSVAGTAGGKPVPAPNPDAGLTDAQRNAIYQQTEASFQQRYKAWLKSAAAHSQNLRALPRHPMAASYLPGQPTLLAAKQKAEVIISGTVTAIRFEPGTAVLTVHVNRTVKGSAGNDILVIQGGGLFPDPDFKHASLTINESAPLL
ncbi:MAG: hypothetical protein ACRDNS_08825, partial [Trebonia sp.]